MLTCLSSLNMLTCFSIGVSLENTSSMLCIQYCPMIQISRFARVQHCTCATVSCVQLKLPANGTCMLQDRSFALSPSLHIMESIFSYLLLAVVGGCILSTTTLADRQQMKRVLPWNENCNPNQGTCVKGDFVKASVADCKFQRSFSHPFSCTARDDSPIHWVVEPEKNGNCLPVSGKTIRCGASGTKTRCVCSSPKLPSNQCRCQYWPQDTPGADQNAFCRAYYIGAGDSGVHHYACCNNCNDPSNTCDGVTYHGGSSTSYCDTCGRPTGGGRVKYYFNCRDCQTQSACKNKCDNSFPGSTLSGLCWKWVDCFTGCCRMMANQYSRRRQASNNSSLSIGEFCGDGTCQQPREDPDTCPSDCCYLRNSTCGNNGCALACCQSSSCCSSLDSAATTAVGSFSLMLVVIALTSLYLFI